MFVGSQSCSPRCTNNYGMWINTHICITVALLLCVCVCFISFLIHLSSSVWDNNQLPPTFNQPSSTSIISHYKLSHYKPFLLVIISHSYWSWMTRLPDWLLGSPASTHHRCSAAPRLTRSHLSQAVGRCKALGFSTGRLLGWGQATINGCDS